MPKLIGRKERLVDRGGLRRRPISLKAIAKSLAGGVVRTNRLPSIRRLFRGTSFRLVGVVGAAQSNFDLRGLQKGFDAARRLEKDFPLRKTKLIAFPRESGGEVFGWMVFVGPLKKKG